MSELIQKFNNVLNDWKKDFTLSDDVQMHFDTDTDGRLCFNSKTISLHELPELEGADFSIDCISFYLSEMRGIHIYIEWPEDEAPYVKTLLIEYAF